MSDIERYRDQAEFCAAHAASTHAASTHAKEIRDLWLSIEGNYRFLLRRVERIETEKTEGI
jgi:3-phenylpropionate/cinnamic acid dioxygenase small subunit